MTSRRSTPGADCTQKAPDGSVLTRCESLVVESVAPLVLAPGGSATIMGKNFRPSMALSDSDTKSGNLTYINETQATITLSGSASYGPVDLLLTQDGVSQDMHLFSNGGKSDYPIITASADQVCSGTQFYNAQ